MSASPPRPARRYGSPTGRIVIPVLFVVLLIVVLGRPILIAGLDLDPEQAEPAPQAGPITRTPKPEGPSRLATGYPKGCLAEASSPGLGLVAASDGTTVTAATPTGVDAFALQALPPIGFSASGRFLATAGADLWTAQGKHIGTTFGGPVDTWAWSPVADCIVGVDQGRLAVAKPSSKPVTLIEEMDVETFAFSPDGSRIVFAVDEGGRSDGIWMADLRTKELKVLQPSPGWTLVAWSPKRQPLLVRDFYEQPSHGPGRRDALAFAESRHVTYCGGETIVVAENRRLSEFGASGTPDYIDADRRYLYTAVSCAPGGDLMLAVRFPAGDQANTTMVVLRRDGRSVRELAQQSGLEDAPMWGPTGTGVVFAGDVSGEGSVGPLVWFLPEGGTSRPTGLRVERLSVQVGDGLDALLDWSATPPLGHPAN